MSKKKKIEDEQEQQLTEDGELVIEIKPKRPKRQHKNPPIEIEVEEAPVQAEPERPRVRATKGAIPVVDVDEAMEGITVDEALAKVAMILAKTADPKVLSELDDQEIKLCAALLVVGVKMESDLLVDFVKHFMTMRVSLKRQGRKELLEIAKSGATREEQRVSRLRQFFSGVAGR